LAARWCRFQCVGITLNRMQRIHAQEGKFFPLAQANFNPTRQIRTCTR